MAVIGAISAIGGAITVSQLSCFLMYANQYTKPFNEVTGVLTQLQTALASAQRLFAVIDAETERPDAPDAPEEDIRAAAKAAYAHSFIKRLPNGYDTVIVPGGGSLSAGQKQLLCIARIFARQNAGIVGKETGKARK